MTTKKVTIELDEHIFDSLQDEADDVNDTIETHIASILYQRNIQSRLFASRLDDMIKNNSNYR